MCGAPALLLGEVAGFAAQLVEACEASGVHRVPHRAARLARVSAIAETALRREFRDVVEDSADGIGAGPQLDLAQAGRVNQEGAGGKLDEFAGRSGVTAAGVGLPGGRGSVYLGAEDSVEQGRLAGASSPGVRRWRRD